MSGKKSTGGLKVGDKAPDFMIPDYDGKDVALSGLRIIRQDVQWLW